jgi:hypothetical protein
MFVFLIFLLSLRFKVFAVTGVILGLIIQGFHSFEHIIQALYWGNYPLAPAFMSPTAKTAAAGLEALAENVGIIAIPTLGMELLHLVGNLIFLTGALTLLLGKGFSKSQRDKARVLVVFEGIHLLEHVITTSFVVAGQTAWGASVVFGELSGSQAATYRIWWHLIMNVAGFILFAWAALPKSAKPRYFVITGFALLCASFIPLLPASSVPKDAGYPGISHESLPLIIVLICISPAFIAGLYSFWEAYYKKSLKYLKNKEPNPAEKIYQKT